MHDLVESWSVAFQAVSLISDDPLAFFSSTTENIGGVRRS